MDHAFATCQSHRKLFCKILSRSGVASDVVYAYNLPKRGDAGSETLQSKLYARSERSCRKRQQRHASLRHSYCSASPSLLAFQTVARETIWPARHCHLPSEVTLHGEWLCTSPHSSLLLRRPGMYGNVCEAHFLAFLPSQQPLGTCIRHGIVKSVFVRSLDFLCRNDSQKVVVRSCRIVLGRPLPETALRAKQT